MTFVRYFPVTHPLFNTLSKFQPQEAKQELSEGLRALDHRSEGRLPASGIVTALKRMGIELRMKEIEMERALRVFQVQPNCISFKI